MSSLKDSYKTFNTSLEDKELYGLKSLGIQSEKLVTVMGSSKIKSLIKDFFNFPLDIISLGDTDDFSVYSFYHVTKAGGCLGSHLDHSYVTLILFISQIQLYASSRLANDWGGETVFYL